MLVVDLLVPHRAKSIFAAHATAKNFFIAFQFGNVDTNFEFKAILGATFFFFYSLSFGEFN